ncbi:MAG: alpha/beta hydrolase [Firmicutes bacterium]|nr:alpha/beta hydrolase [Bacillota bacterium]
MQTIKIWPQDETVSLNIFADAAVKKRPAILVLPGGGYNTCAPAEGDPVGQRFARMGYAAFVLKYAVRWISFADMLAHKQPNDKTYFPAPLRQTAAAMAYIRRHSDQYGVDPNCVAVIGFSAGGHLASNFCNLWNSPEVYSGIADPEEIRPNVSLLLYGATELTQEEVLMSAIYPEQSIYSAEQLSRYTAKNHLCKGVTPPTFLCHSITDPMLPSGETTRLAAALEEAGIPYELHMFGCGGHAWALAEGEPMGAWVDMADSFIRHVAAHPERYTRQYEKAQMEARFRRHGKEDSPQ